MSTCRFCGKEIAFTKGSNGKNYPIETTTVFGIHPQTKDYVAFHPLHRCAEGNYMAKLNYKSKHKAPAQRSEFDEYQCGN